MASTTQKQAAETKDAIEGIEFVDYRDESQIDSVMSLVGRDLSEPYSSKQSECQCAHSSRVSNLILVSILYYLVSV